MNNKYWIEKGKAFIELTHKDGGQEVVVIDAQDLPIAQGSKGHFYPYKHQRTGATYARGYYRDPVTKKVAQPMLHRLIMNPQKGENTAHLNGDTLNSTRANMRNVAIGVDIKELLAKETQAQVEVIGGHAVHLIPTEGGVEIINPWDGSEGLIPLDQEPLKGVSLHKVKQRWEVSPFYEGKRYRLGYFDKDNLAGANRAVTLFRELGPEEYFKRYPKGGK